MKHGFFEYQLWMADDMPTYRHLMDYSSAWQASYKEDLHDFSYETRFLSITRPSVTKSFAVFVPVTPHHENIVEC